MFSRPSGVEWLILCLSLLLMVRPGLVEGTVSKIVAARLGWHYLDSGALYRAVAVAADWAAVDVSDTTALVKCAFDTCVNFAECADGEMRVLVNSIDATDVLRMETTGVLASTIASISEVRATIEKTSADVSAHSGISCRWP